MRNYCNKVVVENFFEPCVLYLLLEKSSYGYELAANLRNHCGCNVNIGNLYRGLSRLEKDGAVEKKKEESSKGPSRFTYSITDKGKELLKEWMEEIEVQMKTMDKLVTNYKKNYEKHI